MYVAICQNIAILSFYCTLDAIECNRMYPVWTNTPPPCKTEFSLCSPMSPTCFCNTASCSQYGPNVLLCQPRICLSILVNWCLMTYYDNFIRIFSLCFPNVFLMTSNGSRHATYDILCQPTCPQCLPCHPKGLRCPAMSACIARILCQPSCH